MSNTNFQQKLIDDWVRDIMIKSGKAKPVDTMSFSSINSSTFTMECKNIRETLEREIYPFEWGLTDKSNDFVVM